MGNAPTEQAMMARAGARPRPNGGEWYVAQTLPRKEAVAQQNLSRQRFASFLPRYKATRHHARKRYDVMAPLFPGYIFIRFNPDEAPWRSINGTVGVQRLVGPKLAGPVAMPASAVDNIMARCRNGIMISLFECLEPGAVMRVMSGPFADRLVTIEALDGPERVRVLLNILGVDQPFAMASGCLGPV
jgi:transcriptional antiterminator RfaH